MARRSHREDASHDNHTLWVIVHCLAVVVFVNRYIGGLILRVVRGKNWTRPATTTSRRSPR